jgi:polysaccharide deacetylase 2 family uncharacterized protein YibQ
VLGENFIAKHSWRKKNGHTIGIGHPHPETSTILKEILPQMSQLNIEIVPVSSQLKNFD